MREFFALWTPKYYKVNISNTKSLLQELQSYISITEKWNYIQEDHVKAIIEEYLYRFERDIILKWYSPFFKSFNAFLKENIENNKKKEDFLIFIDLLKNRLNPLIRNLNWTYFTQCKKQLFDIINKHDNNPLDFTTLKKICYSFSTEILRQWYSRDFIYQNIQDYLIKDNEKDINVDKFIELFNWEIKSYDIYLKIINLNTDIKKIFNNYYWSDNVFFENFPFYVDNKFYSTKIFWDFFKKNNEIKNSFWIKISKMWLDYWSVSFNIIDEINLFLDEIKYEYINENIKIFHHSLSKDENWDINFFCISDSLYVHRNKCSVDFFNTRNENIKAIYNSKIIDDSSKEKIKTIFRFYRYFLEANTIEHKFLNLWIWWEHIFSLDFKKESHTWKNIQFYYPLLDSITFIEDILKDMVQVQLNRWKYKDDINKILWDDSKFIVSNLYKIIKEKWENFNKLIWLNHLDDNDLLKVKLFRLHEKFKYPKVFVENNKNKVLWSLFRLYRVRNSIVHRWNIDVLWLPVDVLVKDLELYYTNLLDFLIKRFTANDRFENLEQLFTSVFVTYNYFVSENNHISKVTDISDIKKKIINIPLTF